MNHPGPCPHSDCHPQEAALRGFLTRRVNDELAALWDHDRARQASSDGAHADGDPRARTRPGLASRLQVLDDLLLTLRSGRLPPAFELRLLLHAYNGHPDYDPDWTTQHAARTP